RSERRSATMTAAAAANATGQGFRRTASHSAAATPRRSFPSLTTGSPGGASRAPPRRAGSARTPSPPPPARLRAGRSLHSRREGEGSEVNPGGQHRAPVLVELQPTLPPDAAHVAERPQQRLGEAQVADRPHHPTVLHQEGALARHA